MEEEEAESHILGKRRQPNELLLLLRNTGEIINQGNVFPVTVKANIT